MLTALVTAIFFASGAASLTLQVVWFKELQFVLGSATFSVSVTVASFFFGLSVGSFLGGRGADAVTRPLRVYGFLELGLAPVSFAVTAFLTHWATWVGWISPMLSLDSPARLPLIVLLSLATLSLPTTLMGATLPFLVRFLTRSRTGLANQIGHLYGFNTLGAAIGTLGVGFVLIGLVGVTGSSLFASTIYACIGGFSLIAARHEHPLPVKREQEQVHWTKSEARGTNFLIWVFACSGFVSIAYEVVWFRFLTNVSSSSVYAFSGMLSTYLFGLVTGALICANFWRPARINCFVTSPSFSSSSRSPPRSPWRHSARPVRFTHLFPDRFRVAANPSTDAVGRGCFVLFHLCSSHSAAHYPYRHEFSPRQRATVMRMSAVGRGIGTLYARNTIGGVLGSLAAGFLLIPYLGSQWTLTVLILMNILLFVAIAVSQRSLRPTESVATRGDSTKYHCCVVPTVWPALSGAAIRRLRVPRF